MGEDDDLTRRVDALRETQLEQGLKIDKIDALVRTQAEHSRILGEHSRELQDHRAMLVTVQAGVDHIVDLLTEQEPPRG